MHVGYFGIICCDFDTISQDSLSREEAKLEKYLTSR
jgi:hypothetical protein